MNITAKTQSRRDKLIDKYKPIVWDIGKYYEVPIPENLNSFKRNLMAFLHFEEGAKIVSYKGLENYIQIPVKKEAWLFIDGERMRSIDLGGFHLAMKNVNAIMVQPIGRGNKIIQVFTKEKNTATELYKSYTVKYGYDKAKSYYRPTYYNFNINNYPSFREVSWKPSIQTDAKGKAYFKIAKPKKSKELFFRFKG